MRSCKKCGETDLTKLAISKTTPDGITGLCKKCDALRHKLYAINNPDIICKARKKSYIKHKKKIRKQQSEYFKYITAHLTDTYIKRNICNTMHIKSKDIPQELIDLKRTQLQLKRAIQNENNNT